jgi:hypothetical protein
MRKTLLGFDFDGEEKTMWLKEATREKLLTILKGWICTGKRASLGDPVWQIRIYCGKNTTCIHMHSSGERATLAVQQSPKTVPGLTYIYITIKPSLRHWRGVGHSFGNPQPNQPVAGNWCLAGQTILESSMHPAIELAGSSLGNYLHVLQLFSDGNGPTTLKMA